MATFLYNSPITYKFLKDFTNYRKRTVVEKCSHFSDFQYSFRPSRSTADLLTVKSDRSARAFNRSGYTQDLILDISKAFNRVWCDRSASQT